jgi:ABC-type nickel/cobalt efflux system permease component RcnA
MLKQDTKNSCFKLVNNYSQTRMNRIVLALLLTLFLLSLSSYTNCKHKYHFHAQKPRKHYHKHEQYHKHKPVKKLRELEDEEEHEKENAVLSSVVLGSGAGRPHKPKKPRNTTTVTAPPTAAPIPTVKQLRSNANQLSLLASVSIPLVTLFAITMN